MSVTTNPTQNLREAVAEYRRMRAEITTLMRNAERARDLLCANDRNTDYERGLADGYHAALALTEPGHDPLTSVSSLVAALYGSASDVRNAAESARSSARETLSPFNIGAAHAATHAAYIIEDVASDIADLPPVAPTAAGLWILWADDPENAGAQRIEFTSPERYDDAAVRTEVEQEVLDSGRGCYWTLAEIVSA